MNAGILFYTCELHEIVFDVVADEWAIPIVIYLWSLGYAGRESVGIPNKKVYPLCNGLSAD